MEVIMVTSMYIDNLHQLRNFTTNTQLSHSYVAMHSDYTRLALVYPQMVLQLAKPSKLTLAVPIEQDCH